VCAHPEVQAINAAFSSANILELARRYHITRDGLMRHRDRHLGSSPEAAAERIASRRVHREAASTRERFLEAYRQTGNLSQSAAAAEVTRGVVHSWREHDDVFNAAFNQAEIEAVELLEAEARERATKGTRLLRRVIRGGRLIEEVEEWRPSDAMLIKLLQALRPEKYGDKLSVTATTTIKTIDSEAWDAV
jgi:hypothetical protein